MFAEPKRPYIPSSSLLRRLYALQCPCARLSSISRTSPRDIVHEARHYKYWLCLTPKDQHALPHHPPPSSSQYEQSSSVRMSHSHTAAAASSPNFQLIFNNALEAYKKRTKNDLLAHPLAAQLQTCNSPSDVLLILQQQVEELNQSRNSDGRLTKWLDPTVNVLYAFSGALGEGVGLVCFMISDRLRSTLMLILRYSPPRK